jgi:hypothetical protein
LELIKKIATFSGLFLAGMATAYGVIRVCRWAKSDKPAAEKKPEVTA